MKTFLNPEFNSFPLRHSGTVISVLEKLLSQSTEQDHPGRLVIEAAHGSAAKVREMVQKYPDKVSASQLRESSRKSLIVLSYFWICLYKGLQPFLL